MFKIIDLYIARTLLSTIAVTLSVLVGLSALIKFVEQLRRIGQGDYDMTIAALYVFLSLPREIELFLPMATLLGALIGMGLLAQSSELVVMQASGLSRTNITLSSMKSVVLIIIAMMAIGEFITPPSETKAKELRTQALSGGSVLSSDNVTWAKDGNDFVSISQVIDQDSLRDIEVYKFDDSLNLTQIMTAQSADFTQRNWILTDVTIMDFGERQIDRISLPELQWDSSLTPDKLGIVAIKPEALSIRGLLDYVGYLENNGQDASRYELALWRKIFQPFSVAVMLLLAMSFIFGPLRSVTMGARTIMGVLAGFGFFISNEVFGQVSLVFQLPPILGAVIPSILFAMISAILLKRQ
ncbi:LPS export ABC transporter permease LptG [Glaciecola sp. XM2]|jgi:lipopolysaccharide export system permease protein|uniref:LPS export ABC transporter permease LptG n=1 Tax=Glaciecola sp. XM2 TaxID=1914931 RepID=UPI001BDF1F9E|nr:LPS export ABC transporter permease LptG [Glaciecola sp. XM2]MBT1452519.1 LPS export ABC transporter permease LptG [Glaciecola sp. XM2]